MPRSALTKIAPTGIDSNATNLTDLSFTTMTAGTDNGVTFKFSRDDLVFVKNDTGTPSFFTIVLPDLDIETTLGAAVTDPQILIGANKLHYFRPTVQMKHSDGLIHIDAGFAGEIAVISGG